MHKILHTKHKRNIAYQHYKGQSSIGLIFFSGFKSDMNGTKAQYIFNWCKKHKIECTIFDYSGHGKSSEDFINCDISKCIEDGMDIIDEALDKVNCKERHITEGNHDTWLNYAVDKYPYIPQYKFKNAVKLKERGYKYHQFGKRLNP